MKVTDIQFTPASFPKLRIYGFASVEVDGGLWLNDITVQQNDAGDLIVCFPRKKSQKTGAQRPYYRLDGLLRAEIIAAVIEQFELFSNVRHETAINHQPVKPAGSNRCLVFR